MRILRFGSVLQNGGLGDSECRGYCFFTFVGKQLINGSASLMKRLDLGYLTQHDKLPRVEPEDQAEAKRRLKGFFAFRNPETFLGGIKSNDLNRSNLLPRDYSLSSKPQQALLDKSYALAQTAAA
jgi:hypothetical protein